MPKPQLISLEEKQFLTPKITIQNQKLRSQVRQLITMIESYTLKMHHRKSQKYKVEKYEPDEELQNKDKHLLKKIKQIKYYQQKTQHLRTQLHETYNIDKIIQFENEIKLKNEKIKELLLEESTLVKVETGQKQALKLIDREDDNESQIEEMKQQLKHQKQIYRNLYYKQVDQEKDIVDKHDQVVKLDHRVRKMKEQIQAYENPHNQVQKDTKTENVLSTKAFEQLQKDRKKKEHEMRSKLQHQDKQILDLEYEVKLLEIKTREKFQESRLAELKHKELLRNLKFQLLQPLEKHGKQRNSLNSRVNFQSTMDSRNDKKDMIIRKTIEKGRVKYENPVLTEQNIRQLERDLSRKHKQQAFMTQKRSSVDHLSNYQSQKQNRYSTHDFDEYKSNSGENKNDYSTITNPQQQDRQLKSLGKIIKTSPSLPALKPINLSKGKNNMLLDQQQQIQMTNRDSVQSRVQSKTRIQTKNNK